MGGFEDERADIRQALDDVDETCVPCSRKTVAEDGRFAMDFDQS